MCFLRGLFFFKCSSRFFLVLPILCVERSETRVRNFVCRRVPNICPLFTFLLNFLASPLLQTLYLWFMNTQHMTMLYSSESLVGQLTNEHPMGIITTPGCEKYVLSVLTPFHLTTCRSGSKASFFPIKVRVSCAQYEQHEIDDMPENAHTNASDHLKTTFRLFVTPWHIVISAFKLTSFYTNPFDHCCV